MKVMIDDPILALHPTKTGNWIVMKNFFSIYGIIPKGFVTDLASIPRLFWRLIAPFELGITPVVGHDWGYRTKVLPRDDIDTNLLLDMEKENIPYWRRYTAYWLVRSFGWMSYGKSPVVIEEVEEV
jgi:hypothetical protein